jgi:hypothetical protein
MRCLARTSIARSLSFCLLGLSGLLASGLSASPASPQSDPGSSVLLLRDGRRLVGEIRHLPEGYVVETPAGRETVPDADVLRWIPRQDLLAQLERLRKQPGAKSAFQTVQRAIFCFENGLEDKGWAAYGRALGIRSLPPSLGRLRQIAGEHLLARYSNRPLVMQGRKLLLGCRDAKGDALVRARNDAASDALRQLLLQERTQLEQRAAKDRRQSENASSEGQAAATEASAGRSELAELVRKYAEEALGSDRRAVARRALLDTSREGRHFVYRLAVRHPDGPTRSAIMDEVEQRAQRDDAAEYLSGALHTSNGELRLRAVDVLGDLRSTVALPALRTARKAAIASLRKARAASGGGGGSRGYVAVTKEQSYIADFNVEVASGAAIADPVIRTVSSGVVLDARVVGVEIIRYYTRFVRKIDNAMAAIERG